MEIRNLDEIVAKTKDPELDSGPGIYGTKCCLHVFCDIDGEELWCKKWARGSVRYDTWPSDDEDPDVCRVGIYTGPRTREELIADMEQAIAEKKAENALCDDEDD